MSGLVGKSDAGLTISRLPLCPPIMSRAQSVELVMEFLVEVAFATGDLLQRPADVVGQPPQLASCVFHTRVDRARVLVHLIDVIAPVLLARCANKNQPVTTF